MGGAPRRPVGLPEADVVDRTRLGRDVARITALVALDDHAPRVVEIAGDRVTARDLARTMTQLTGHPFTLQWAGTTASLSALSTITRRVSKTTDDTFPAWQGM